MGQSIGYNRFKQRMDYFLIDHEFAELIVENKEFIKGEDTVFRSVNPINYPLLLSKKACAQSRTIVVEHLRRTIYISFIKDLYEEVTEYLQYILLEGANSGVDAKRIVEGQQLTMTLDEILTAVYNNELNQIIIGKIFQDLDRQKSTTKLIDRIIKKLGLNIEKQLLKNALPYLNLRHVLVHDDGKPKKIFLQEYPQFTIRNARIHIDANLIKDAYKKVNALVLALDNEMIQHGYISLKSKRITILKLK